MGILAVVSEAALPLAIVPANLLPVDHDCVVFAWNLTVIAYVLDDYMQNWILGFL